MVIYGLTMYSLFCNLLKVHQLHNYFYAETQIILDMFYAFIKRVPIYSILLLQHKYDDIVVP